MLNNAPRKDQETMPIPVEVDPALAQGWQAICNGHAGGWYGECRTTSKDAKSDKESHDKELHNGESWAVVVKRTCDADPKI